MENDPRLPTKEQIQMSEVLLSERKKWLKEVFIPRLQEEFPEFEQSYIQSNVVAITEEDLEDYEEGEKIYNTPLTDFEITLGKLIDLPDPQIDAAIKEIRKKRIWPNDFEEQCRKHRFAVEIKWTDELLKKIEEINARTTELLTELYEKLKILRDILNEEYEKGNKLFADFEITGQIVYTNHNLNLYPENKNPELAHLLCEMTNHHIPSHGTLLYWNGRGDKDLEEVLYLGKDIKKWNIEIFRTVSEEIPINYYMHSVFMDRDTYNLGDMLNMKPQDFQTQITIKTWDYMPEREDLSRI
nr:hypothetical protein [uncultured Treponema sp.]